MSTCTREVQSEGGYSFHPCGRPCKTPEQEAAGLCGPHLAGQRRRERAAVDLDQRIAEARRRGRAAQDAAEKLRAVGVGASASEGLVQIAPESAERVETALAALDETGEPVKYLGEVEAESAEQALELAQGLDASVSLCHQCSREVSGLEVECFTVYNADDDSDTATDRADASPGRSESALALLDLVEGAWDRGLFVGFDPPDADGPMVRIVDPKALPPPPLAGWIGCSGAGEGLTDACRRLLAEIGGDS
jgi:hypothetical protein